MQSRKPGAFVSRCLVIEGELVWTQCAMRDQEWIESCMTGPDQVNIGATRRAVGAEAEGGVEGRVDADIVLARMLMLVLMLARARFLKRMLMLGDIVFTVCIVRCNGGARRHTRYHRWARPRF